MFLLSPKTLTTQAQSVIHWRRWCSVSPTARGTAMPPNPTNTGSSKPLVIKSLFGTPHSLFDYASNRNNFCFLILGINWFWRVCCVWWCGNNAGGKLVYQTTKKRASGPKCPVTGKRIQGVRFLLLFQFFLLFCCVIFSVRLFIFFNVTLWTLLRVVLD